ncbi:hypothetical protein QBC35DRAFT_127853 [Podospora australis]|uniref:Uncharacterized protein n=1 Tax=Podospora australis TaxID=1536484 RepID=A0AAN6WY62_9PEZI|nr:hypothetical protein QBC35DRAFT_127853 [Podospora australis]
MPHQDLKTRRPDRRARSWGYRGVVLLATARLLVALLLSSLCRGGRPSRRRNCHVPLRKWTLDQQCSKTILRPTKGTLQIVRWHLDGQIHGMAVSEESALKEGYNSHSATK